MSLPRYRLVVKENWDHATPPRSTGMTLRAHDGETDITGPIIDQSHLQGLLERIASLGLTLRSLTPLETENAPADPRPHTQPAGVTDHNPRTHSKGP